MTHIIWVISYDSFFVSTMDTAILHVKIVWLSVATITTFTLYWKKVYMNLDQKSSTNQRPDFNGPSSFKPNFSIRQNLRDLSHKIAFLVYMNSDHFRVHLRVGLYATKLNASITSMNPRSPIWGFFWRQTAIWNCRKIFGTLTAYHPQTAHNLPPAHFEKF